MKAPTTHSMSCAPSDFVVIAIELQHQGSESNCALRKGIDFVIQAHEVSRLAARVLDALAGSTSTPRN